MTLDGDIDWTLVTTVTQSLLIIYILESTGNKIR
jgi:hypothetical protein